MRRNESALGVFGVSVFAVLFAWSSPARASFITTETWSNPPSVESWPSAGGTYPVYNADGNPYTTGGALGIRTDDYYNGSVWYQQLPSSYAGNWGTKFGTSGNIEFDLKVWSGSSATPAGNAPDGYPWGKDPNGVDYSATTTSYFNLYEPSYAGWRHPISAQGSAAGLKHYSFAFDANWTDAQAISNGWIAGEYGAGTWASTVANIGVAVQSTGFKFNASGYSMHLALDNFTPGPALVPEPSTAALLALAGTLFCGRRSRQRRA